MAQENIYQHQNMDIPFSTKTFGYGPNKKTASPDYLDAIKLKDSLQQDNLSELGKRFYSNYAKGYLKQIKNICDQNDISLIFLYLPPYGTILPKPNECETYEKYGDLWIPPPHIFENQANWGDNHHMNENGAKELSEWLISKINRDF